MLKKIGRLLALLFLLFLIAYALTNKEAFKPLTEIPLILVVLIGLLKVVVIFINGLYTKITLDAFDKPISHKESSYIALLSSLGNYFGPILGGMGVRATYLKTKHGFALTHFVGTLYGYYLISFFTVSIIGLVGLWLVYSQNDVYSITVFAAFSIVTLSTGALFFIKIPKTNKYKKYKFANITYKRLKQLSEGWEVLAQNSSLLFRLLILGFCTIIIAIITAYLEFIALDLPITFGGLLLYATLGAFSILVSFTPGAIGIRESIYIFSSDILNLSNAQILQLAAIDRGVALLILVLSYIYLQFLQKRT